MPEKKEPILQRISFQWRGRTKEGVSRWWGNSKGPPEWFGKLFFRYGQVAGVVGLCALVYAASARNPAALPIIIVGLVHSLVFGLSGYWVLRLRRTLSGLRSAEELAQEHGVEVETIRQAAAEHGIRARININDVNLYDPDEFTAARSLLRAASAPIAPETLLRPAEPEASRTAPETLLRPAEPGLETEQAVVQPQYQAEEQKNEIRTTG